MDHDDEAGLVLHRNRDVGPREVGDVLQSRPPGWVQPADGFHQHPRPGDQHQPFRTAGAQGGHDVDAEKIVAKYHKTHALLREALSRMDVAFVYDSDPGTAGGPVLLITLSPGDGLTAQVPVEDMPALAAQLLNPASR